MPCKRGTVVATAFLLEDVVKASSRQSDLRMIREGTPAYLMLLGSHTILAMINLPMVLATLWRAWRERWEDHRRLARWTFPIWMYVSVTGVLVYAVLYHLNRNIKLELTGAFKTVIWSTSDDSWTNGDTYAVPARSFVLGVGVLFPVSF